MKNDVKVDEDFKDINEKNKNTTYVIVIILYIIVIALFVLFVIGLKNKKDEITSNSVSFIDSNNYYLS